MTIWSRIKKFFDLDNDKKEELVKEQLSIDVDKKLVDNGSVDTQPQPSPVQERTYNPYTKFEAEFHNPRLSCFGCQSMIEEGKVRFMNVGSEEKAFHKACLKKMKSGKLPTQN